MVPFAGAPGNFSADRLANTPTKSWITPYSCVDGNVHTNGLENFWSLLKRGLNGTYVSVEPYNLFCYLDEQAFRFSNRKVTDGKLFSAAVSGIVGKRVTWDNLIGRIFSNRAELSEPQSRRGNEPKARSQRPHDNGRTS
ncbi:MAG: transposase [Bryobacteraceae bacterium]|nr:transposase [Bryobacteraceae bacterium]